MTRPDDFHAFSTEHIVTLAVIGGVTAALCVVTRRTKNRAVRTAVCWSVAALTFGGWAFKQVQYVARGAWTLSDSVPLHLCDIGNIVTCAALIAVCRLKPPSWTQWLYEFAYFWGLAGTMQALITPDVPAPFPHVDYVRFFITHGGIVTGVLVMTLGLRMRPRPSSFWRVWRATALLAAVVFVLNFPLGGNYMYLHGPPKRASIIDLMGPWPWSLAPLVVVGTLVLMLAYSPYWLRDRWRRRQDNSGRG